MAEDTSAGLSLAGLRDLFQKDTSESTAPDYVPTPDPPKPRADKRGVLLKVPPKTSGADIQSMIRDEAWDLGWPSGTAVMVEPRPTRRGRPSVAPAPWSLRAGDAHGDVFVVSSDPEAITYSIPHHPDSKDFPKAAIFDEDDGSDIRFGFDLGVGGDKSTAMALSVDPETGVKTVLALETFDASELGKAVRDIAEASAVSMATVVNSLSAAVSSMSKATATAAEFEEALGVIRKEAREPRLPSFPDIPIPSLAMPKIPSIPSIPKFSLPSAFGRRGKK